MSEFWKHINKRGFDTFWDTSNKQEIEEAQKLLVSELPDADKWREHWGYGSARPLLYLFLLWMADNSLSAPKNPKPMQYNPKDITLHFAEEEFQDILFQKMPRGAITLAWSTIDDGGGFTLPSGDEKRVLRFVRDCFCDDVNGHCSLDSGVLCFIRKKKLELYIFPEKWLDIVEYVHHEIDKMTAVEKVRKELPHELKSFVDLLGWESVNTELAKLK